MAIDISTPQQKRYGIAEQTTWGTAVADTAAAIQLDVDPFSIVPNVNIREGRQSQGTRRPFTGSRIHDTKRVAPTFSLPAMEAKKDELDYFLYAIMQSVSEGATTPFSKTFTIPDSQPDFSSSAGFFMTFWERFPVSLRSRKLKDVIAKSLTLSCEPGGRLMVAGEFVGRGAMIEGANPTGTWTRSDSDNADYFFWEDIDRFTMDFGSGAVNLRPSGSFEITLSHDATPFGHDGSGNFETFAIVNWNLELKMTIADDLTANIRNSFESAHRQGTVCTLEIGWGNDPPSADGDLEITCQCQITDVSPDSADILGIEVTGAIATSNTSNSPITIILANALDRGW
jgi:hypothetical protein